MRSWRTHGSRVVYENAWIRVREDEVTRPDGGRGIYGVVETTAPSVFIVALTAAEEVLLVGLERYTTGRPSLEIPAGNSEGDDPLVAARRELREETGRVAGSWELVGRSRPTRRTSSAAVRATMNTEGAVVSTTP